MGSQFFTSILWLGLSQPTMFDYWRGRNHGPRKKNNFGYLDIIWHNCTTFSDQLSGLWGKMHSSEEFVETKISTDHAAHCWPGSATAGAGRCRLVAAAQGCEENSMYIWCKLLLNNLQDLASRFAISSHIFRWRSIEKKTREPWP